MTDGQETTQFSKYSEHWRPKWAPLLVLVPPIAPFFWRYRVDFDGKDLKFGYKTSAFSKQVALENISGIHAVDVDSPITQWGGWGIRMKLSGETGYIAASGPAVQFTDTTNGKNKVYVLTCQDTRTLCEAVKAAQKATVQ